MKNEKLKNPFNGYNNQSGQLTGLEFMGDNIRKNLKYCSICSNITDVDPCPICANAKRDKETICVVEDVRDIIPIEKTHEYNGVYHVLHGVISPMNGIGPNDIKVKELVSRLPLPEAVSTQFREEDSSTQGNMLPFCRKKPKASQTLRAFESHRNRLCSGPEEGLHPSLCCRPGSTDMKGGQCPPPAP